MKNRIKFRPLGPVAKAADRVMWPIMHDFMVMNACSDSPQLTHRWNNRRLSRVEVAGIDHTLSVVVDGDPLARRLPGGLRHFPCIGWQEYVVLRPSTWQGPWHMGWNAPDVASLSRIRLLGPARALRGPGHVEFFAVDSSGRQLKIEVVDYGRLGDGSANKTLSLL